MDAIRTTAEAPRTQGWFGTAAAGAAVIAVCYGFARYAYGLFVPTIRDGFGLTGSAVGLLGGLSTAGYALGLLAAPRASARSSRAAVLGAGAAAVVGLAGMGLATSVPLFAVALMVAGASAGLVSPAVAQLVTERVASPVRGRAQTWANTGTSFGLAASAFIPLLGLDRRTVFLLFAAVAAAVTAVAFRRLRGPLSDEPLPDDPAAASRSGEPAAEDSARWPLGLAALLVNSVLLGVVTAPYWTFSTSRLLDSGLSSTSATWCWFVIGAAGPLGGLAGVLSERVGLRRANVGIWTAAAAGLALMALPAPGLLVATVAAALFGATYMGLTGLCILWGARLFPDLPSRGVTMTFFALGVGQTCGAAAAGALSDVLGLAAVFGLAASLSLTVWMQLHRRLGPPAALVPSAC